MGYSAEILQRARTRLEQARAEREAENQAHLREAYEKVPRIREIDRQLRQTMAVAAQTVFSQGGDVEAAMNAAKEKNLALQKEREDLAARYIAPGYQDDRPVCERCGGTGYIGSTMCDCLAQLCQEEQKKDLTVLGAGRENFADFRLDYYPDRKDARMGVNIRQVMKRTYEICREYAETFTLHSGNLLFSGDTGLGKTFLSGCIAGAVTDRGYSVVYESAGHLFAELERVQFGRDEEARRSSTRYRDCDLLIVDDLGTEMPGGFVTYALYTLVNDRILDRKPTIISTNLNSEDLNRRYSPQIASRLRGEYIRIPFLGDDIRILKERRR